MVRGSFIIKMEGFMMANGRITKCKDLAPYIINQITKPMKAPGSMISFTAMENFITIIPPSSKTCSTITLSTKLTNSGSTMKVISL